MVIILDLDKENGNVVVSEVTCDRCDKAKAQYQVKTFSQPNEWNSGMFIWRYLCGECYKIEGLEAKEKAKESLRRDGLL